jgi:beta-lactam-binding protein with PASTA domain
LEIATSDHYYSPTVAAGRIVSQQPEPGMRVRTGWRVQAAESLGPQLSEIPAVAGMSPRAAEINLRRRGLELGETAELPTADAAPEAIIAQSPAPGAQGVVSPRVSLLYAAAPPEAAYAMPDLSGMTLTEATSLITAAGLKTLSVTNVATLTAPASGAVPIIVGQSPPAGSRVEMGSSVTLQVRRL